MRGGGTARTTRTVVEVDGRWGESGWRRRRSVNVNSDCIHPTVLLTDHAATVLDTHRMTVGSGGRGCGEGRAWSVPRCLQRGGSWVVVVVLHLTPRHEVADGKVSAATVPPPSGRPGAHRYVSGTVRPAPTHVTWRARAGGEGSPGGLRRAVVRGGGGEEEPYHNAVCHEGGGRRSGQEGEGVVPEVAPAFASMHVQTARPAHHRPLRPRPRVSLRPTSTTTKQRRERRG